jgi:uncharacterized protein
MNEAMLAFVTKPKDVGSLDELRDDSYEGLRDATKRLRELGILLAPEDAGQDDIRSLPEGSGSTTNLAIFVTTKCNLRCAYCYAQGGDSGKTISRDIWGLAMDHYFSTLRRDAASGQANPKSVHLAIHGGGEATVEFVTLRDIVADFREHACVMGMQSSVGMGTNGAYDDLVHQWIIENDIGVNISLDGPRDVQNRLRPFRSGQSSFDTVVCNLQSLVKAGRRVSIRVTVTACALESMEETVELANELGLAAVHFEPVSITGRCATSTLARPDAEQFADNFLKCFLLGLKYDIDVHYSGMRCFEKHRRSRFCGACGHNLCVTPDGNITTCYEVLNSKDPAASTFFIGEVDPVQGRVVLDQARIQQLRQRVVENMKACMGCFLRYLCAGDCPVKSYRYSNRDLCSPDPYRCQIAIRVNRQLIAWLADGVIEPRGVEQTSVVTLNQSLV